MATINYAQLANTAKTLVDQNGRDVTFQLFDQTPSTPSKPWNGVTDPDGTPDATATVKGVFVPMSVGKSLGLETIDEDLLKATEEVCLVAPGSTSPPFDLATANMMVDSGVRKGISFVRTLKPNTVTLLYFIGVAK